MSSDSQWMIWRTDEAGYIGVAIVHPASDYGLQLFTALDQQNRKEWLERLCKVLNAARERGEL